MTTRMRFQKTSTLPASWRSRSSSCAALLLGAVIAASAQAESLDAILARMDASARQFHSFSAHIQRTDFTAVLNDSEVMNGTIRMKRDKNGVTGIMDFTEPNAHIIAIAGHTVQIFHPKGNAVEIYDTTKYRSVLDEHLLLGFGTTAAELQKAYDAKVTGSESVGPVKATRIELTPKSAQAQQIIRKIDLWIPEGQSNPVQEKITTPSKDTKQVGYSELKINPELPDSAFVLKLPPDVHKLQPNKK